MGNDARQLWLTNLNLGPDRKYKENMYELFKNIYVARGYKQIDYQQIELFQEQ